MSWKVAYIHHHHQRASSFSPKLKLNHGDQLAEKHDVLLPFKTGAWIFLFVARVLGFLDHQIAYHIFDTTHKQAFVYHFCHPDEIIDRTVVPEVDFDSHVHSVDPFPAEKTGGSHSFVVNCEFGDTSQAEEVMVAWKQRTVGIFG